MSIVFFLFLCMNWRASRGRRRRRFRKQLKTWANRGFCPFDSSCVVVVVVFFFNDFLNNQNTTGHRAESIYLAKLLHTRRPVDRALVVDNEIVQVGHHDAVDVEVAVKVVALHVAIEIARVDDVDVDRQAESIVDWFEISSCRSSSCRWLETSQQSEK